MPDFGNEIHKSLALEGVFSALNGICDFDRSRNDFICSSLEPKPLQRFSTKLRRGIDFVTISPLQIGSVHKALKTLVLSKQGVEVLSKIEDDNCFRLARFVGPYPRMIMLVFEFITTNYDDQYQPFRLALQDERWSAIVTSLMENVFPRGDLKPGFTSLYLPQNPPSQIRMLITLQTILWMFSPDSQREFQDTEACLFTIDRKDGELRVPVSALSTHGVLVPSSERDFTLHTYPMSILMLLQSFSSRTYSFVTHISSALISMSCLDVRHSGGIQFEIFHAHWEFVNRVARSEISFLAQTAAQVSLWDFYHLETPSEPLVGVNAVVPADMHQTFISLEGCSVHPQLEFNPKKHALNNFLTDTTRFPHFMRTATGTEGADFFARYHKYEMI